MGLDVEGLEWSENGDGFKMKVSKNKLESCEDGLNSKLFLVFAETKAVTPESKHASLIKIWRS